MIKWIIVLAFLGIIALCTWRGYKSGIVRSVFVILAIVISIYGASLIAGIYNEEFDGMISGVSAGGVYVVLPNTIEGMVSAATMPMGDYEVQHGVILTGAIDGSVYTVGDKVRVKCVSVNVNGGFIDFEFVGNPGKPAKSEKADS